MDPISQGALGAAVTLALASPERRWVAALAGALGGMAPDLDILIRSADDPLLALDFHRQFTHSLIFIPVGGVFVGSVMHGLARLRTQLRNRLGTPPRGQASGRATGSWRELVVFATLGWATHGLLDACTTYGTQLLWPFTDLRVTWAVVGVVDPVPTLAWVVGVGLALWRGRQGAARAGLALGLAYLGLGGVQHLRARQVQAELVASRGHTATRAEVKPTLLNLLIWRSLYIDNGVIHADALRMGTTPQVYPGASVPLLSHDPLAPSPPEGSVQARDLARFTWFSDGWVAVHPNHPNVAGDARYALVPNEVAPLWGIILDPARPDAHVPFENFREPTPETWQQLAGMFRGDAPTPSTPTPSTPTPSTPTPSP
jgi:inner membrane protein